MTTLHPLDDTFIAIVGMAGRFPGAPDLDGFWAALADGRESVTRFSPHPITGRTPAYAMIDRPDEFDSAFFGCSPHEALMLDPQHRVFLECAWEALEHAGCDPARYPGVIGVYGGSGDTGHFTALRANRARLGVSEWQLRIASGADFLTSRVAYKLGLSGPAVTVQTACSTSLVAVHVAAQALLAGDCDLALAGGVTVRVPHPVDDGGDDDGILSADGRCRAFDSAATGTVGGDGAGIVALKRLADALADGDSVHAVIRGSAVNNDGAGKIGFTAPSVDGQAAAIRAAHQVADVDPASIGYVEAHGTGTPIGDPIEVRALTKAFARSNSATGSTVLGSVKANIGHTDAAAGVIGLIKVVLSLTHEMIPGTAHFTSPNPALELADSPFLISGEARGWPRTAAPRLAGVNSLGIGGTNAHVVVQEAPLPAAQDAGRPHQLLPLSGRSPAAVADAARRLADRLRSGSEPLADVAWTLQTGRRAFAHRSFVVAGDRDDAARALAAVGAGRTATGAGERARPVAFLFPGQGGQHVGMAGELYQQEPVFRDVIDECARLAAPTLGLDLGAVLYPQDSAAARIAAERLASMPVAQTALFVTQLALARLWQSCGVHPESVLGHSLGAYAAATVAGVFEIADALDLVLTRGTLLQSLPPGAMLAVPLPEGRLAAMLTPGTSIAAVNGPAQCVVTGVAAEVADLHRRLADAGVKAQLLHINAAAHSVLVESVADAFERRVAQVRLRPPTIPWISDRTGSPIAADEACSPAYWRAHLRHTVRFSDALSSLLTGTDAALLEVGPGRTLGGLARNHPAIDAGRPVIASLPHPSDPGDDAAFLLTAAGQLWQAGVPIDWNALHAGESRRKVPLPSYPFERQRFRLPAEGSDDRPAEVVTPAPAIRFERPAPDQHLLDPSTDTERAVADAFGQVLGMREVAVDDNFFDLGGDSLVAAGVVARLRDSIGARITVRELFRSPTVCRLAAVIDEEVAA